MRDLQAKDGTFQSGNEMSNEGRCAAALLTKCGRGRRASLFRATERAARGRFLACAASTNDRLGTRPIPGHRKVRVTSRILLGDAALLWKNNAMGA